MRALLTSLCALLCAAAARPFNAFPADTESEEVRSAAIKRLLEVFGMEDPPAVHGHKQPPQYMLDLYNTVADVDGMTRDPSLLEGNTVRSFFDRREFETQTPRVGSVVVLMSSLSLQCAVSRWSSGSTCQASPKPRRS